MSILKVTDIDAYYGKAKILNGVSLEVSKGERVALVGRNGMGKTTLVNSLLGIARVRTGTIEFNGVEQKSIKHFFAAMAGISVVPQGRRIIPNLTVRENLQIGAASNRPGQWNFESVCQLFPILKERADTLGTAMSGGQQQMLAIGRALMANPSLLILDEPSEGLAPVIVDELAEVLKELAASGTSILLIEQNIGLIYRVAERYYVVSKGEIVDENVCADVSLDALKKHVAV